MVCLLRILSRAAKKCWCLTAIQLIDLCVRFDLVSVAVDRIATPAHTIPRLGVAFRMLILPNANDLSILGTSWVLLRPPMLSEEIA